MEPTRVGQFDDEMYYKFECGLYSVKVDRRLISLDFYDELINIGEQRIADSHDITKSDFGWK